MITDTRKIALDSRINCLQMITKAKAAHLGSSLSVIDILTILFGKIAKLDLVNSDSLESDQVIVSKGHAAAGTYAVMANCNIFSKEILETYCADGSLLGGHVTYGKVPGISLSTGSLGHGLPFGLGLALARQRAKAKSFVYVVLSDGECDEGTTWESALIANQFNVGNLVVLIDRNRHQSFGDTESTISLEPLTAKWESFNWRVFEVDGHDHDAMFELLANLKENQSDKPAAIVCNTVKGKGVSFMENDVVWHYRPPSVDQLNQALQELGKE